LDVGRLDGRLSVGNDETDHVTNVELRYFLPPRPPPLGLLLSAGTRSKRVNIALRGTAAMGLTWYKIKEG
jgi:hypothetical protein